MVDHDPVFLDATLRPNPPMSPKVLKLTLALVASLNLAFASYFVFRGAWPVMPFMGLDVALLAWAFRASVRASKKSEHVTLTRELGSVDYLYSRSRLAVRAGRPGIGGDVNVARFGDDHVAAILGEEVVDGNKDLAHFHRRCAV